MAARLAAVPPASVPVVTAVVVGSTATVVGPVGVTLPDGADGRLGPIAFVAVTVNVYAVPWVRPGTTTLVALAPASTDTPPGDDVAVYFVMALPPFDAGGV